MATYQYMKLPSDEYGQDFKVRVWKVKNNKASLIGEKHDVEGATKGAHALAAQLVADEEGYHTDRGGYNIPRKDVKLNQIYANINMA